MNKSHLKPTTRFSSRAENYVKYRPHYPDEIIDYLKKENVLDENSLVADIGSGTGFSSELFLKNGYTVYGVEPNKEMREEGEKYLSVYENFISVNGTAENTTLKSDLIDIIAAGQAFHWFDLRKTKQEFKRILKKEGFIVLIWNVRNFDEINLNRDYAKLLSEFGTDYEKVRHQTIRNRKFDKFYSHGAKTAYFPNEQTFDFDGLKGRLLSSSYAPDENNPNYFPMLKKLKEIFNKHKLNGTVRMKYTTEVYYGKIF
jgi:SAM-dependent methyltransferase